uniref:Uncharacterized protein n=1 Tax=Leersia perrieri TaxID=77586 RepID=A0A0D9WGX1_9ORYZ
MDKTTIIVSAVAGSLGVLSAVMGFAAEVARTIDCASALRLPVAASIFLMMAKVTVAAGVSCRKSRAILSVSKRIVRALCALVSWIAAVLAFVLFLDTGFGSDNSSIRTAVALGICAAIFLLITHVTVAAINYCSSCCIQSETNRFVCIVLLSVAPVTTFVLFVYSAVDKHKISIDCDVILGDVYVSAGVLALISTGLGIAPYLMLRTHRHDEPTLVWVPMVPMIGGPVPVVAQGIACQAPNPQFAYAADPRTHGYGYGQPPIFPHFVAPPPARGYESQSPPGDATQEGDRPLPERMTLNPMALYRFFLLSFTHTVVSKTGNGQRRALLSTYPLNRMPLLFVGLMAKLDGDGAPGY